VEKDLKKLEITMTERNSFGCSNVEEGMRTCSKKPTCRDMKTGTEFEPGTRIRRLIPKTGKIPNGRKSSLGLTKGKRGGKKVEERDTPKKGVWKKIVKV